MSGSGKYQGGHGGAGRDLPPINEIDSCSRAGPSRIRYNENELPKMCSRKPPIGPKKSEENKPKALEPPTNVGPPTELEPPTEPPTEPNSSTTTKEG